MDPRNSNLYSDGGQSNNIFVTLQHSSQPYFLYAPYQPYYMYFQSLVLGDGSNDVSFPFYTLNPHYSNQIWPQVPPEVNPLDDLALEDGAGNFPPSMDDNQSLVYPDLDEVETEIHFDDDDGVITEIINIGGLDFILHFLDVDELNEGLQEETILKNLRIRKYGGKEDIKVTSSSHACEEEICVICQVEYKDKEEVGVLNCGHEYHGDCLKTWLLQKNVCPLCKQTALQAV